MSIPTNSPKPAQQRPHKGGLGGGAFIPTVIILAVLLFALVVFASFWTELQWFDQIKALRVFWTQYGASIVLGLIGLLLVALVVGLNFRIAAGKPKSISDVDIATGQASSVLAKHKVLCYILLPLAVGAFSGTPLASHWQTFLLWFNGDDFGTKDPEFGLDVSFYVFTMPALGALLSFLVTLLVLAFVGAAVGYWAAGNLINASATTPKLSKKAQRHAGILFGIGGLLAAAYFWLARYNLLLGNNPRFSGASYSDINALKPGLTVLAVTTLIVAVLFVWAALRHQWKPGVVGLVTVVLTAIVTNWVYPALLQQFKVTPNAVELESEYIQRNINSTLEAYGLQDIETNAYAAKTSAQAGQLRKDSETAAQIRLLDPNIVDPSFNQLQQSRQYYQFLAPLSVDRYTVDGQLRDTVIAVRELNLNGLDQSNRSWVNDHTVYTHGFGVAAAYGNTMTSRGDPAFWEGGIPSAGELGDYEPRVYFGQQSPQYSVVGAPESSEPWEIDYPDDGGQTGNEVKNTYQGDGGPRIGNAFERLMYAIKFRSTDLYFSDRVTSKSQILFDRDPQQRISKVAPYLTLDSKAIPAVVDMDDNPDTPKELVWIVDGYTTSNNYPYSARETLEEATIDSQTRAGQMLGVAPEQINYIRNSVKAVVNAYDGSVKIFQWDQKDPIINAWSDIFPGQITPLSKMPGDLIAHVRYPEDLFKVQRQLLARYHVTDAQSFYSGGDFWQIPREPTMEANAATPAQPPYYLTLKMPGQDEPTFSLTSSYIPGGQTNRNIMTGFLAADGNAGNETGKIADGYGKLRLLELPRRETVPGPGQAENTMLTNPEVSTDLNLLRQGGTEILEGNLLSLPVGDGLLYVQPIYVQASSGTQYPTLQYVLTLFGDKVGFAPTLDESLDKVFGGDSGVNAGDASIVGDKEAPVDSSSATSGKQGTDTGNDDDGAGKSTPAAPASPTAPTSAAPAPGNKSSSQDSQDNLDAALQDAKKAIEDSQSAMSKGDWSAYGKAQDALNEAIERAVVAQRQIDAKQ